MARIDISAISGYIQKYDKKLISQMLEGLDCVTDLSEGLRRNVREELNLPKMVVDEGIRPLNTDIEEPKGGRTWTARKLTPRHFMKIIKVKPEDARKSFMSAMMGPNATREPFAAWSWAQEFKKIAQELNKNFYLAKYHNDPAEFDAGETYDVGDLVYFNKGDKRGKIVYECLEITTAGQSPSTHAAKWKDVDASCLYDGPGTLIAALLTASSLSAFAGGAFDETNAYDAFKDQFDAIPEEHKDAGLCAYCSVDAGSDLMADINAKFGSGKGIGNVDIDISAGQTFTLKNTAGRLKVKPVTWMKTSRRIIITPPQNMIIGIDSLSDVNSVGKLVETLHGYETVIKGMMTFNFADLETLYVNNQA